MLASLQEELFPSFDFGGRNLLLLKSNMQGAKKGKGEGQLG